MNETYRSLFLPLFYNKPWIGIGIAFTSGSLSALQLVQGILGVIAVLISIVVGILTGYYQWKKIKHKRWLDD